MAFALVSACTKNILTILFYWTSWVCSHVWMHLFRCYKILFINIGKAVKMPDWHGRTPLLCAFSMMKHDFFLPVIEFHQEEERNRKYGINWELSFRDNFPRKFSTNWTNNNCNSFATKYSSCELQGNRFVVILISNYFKTFKMPVVNLQRIFLAWPWLESSQIVKPCACLLQK